MSITTGQNGVASDFITQAEKNATPANDAGRVPQLETDGKLSGFFTKNGQILNAGATINGATLPVPVYQNKTDNELYVCDGNDHTKLKYIGFATSNSTDGNPINFQGAGIVGGFSGLDEGEKYYLSDTAGTISTSPGTYAVLVGVAISPTELLIQKGRRNANGTISVAEGADESTTNTAITTGFRPSVIRVWATASEPLGESPLAFGSWVNGVYASLFKSSDESSSQQVSDVSTSYIANIYEAGGTELWQVTITSVTDTGFTITSLQKDALNAGTLVLAWEAEGEL